MNLLFARNVACTCCQSYDAVALIFLLPAKGYTAEHEKVTFDESTGIGTIHITQHAQSSLGDVVFVELPVTGTKAAKGGQQFIPLSSRIFLNVILLYRYNWCGGEREGCF